jgi:hypothetical protein
MISKQEYFAIRGEYNFLYRYFLKAGGVNVGEQSFYVLLNDWMEMQGINHRKGQMMITKFLDRKFGQ